MREIKKLNLGVCAGRHEMPVEDYIFNKPIEDVTDVTSLRKEAFNSLQRIMKDKGIEMESMHLGSRSGDYQGYAYPCVVNLYCTGLTVAVLAALETVVHHCCQWSLWHYDAKENKYYRQDLFF